MQYPRCAKSHDFEQKPKKIHRHASSPVQAGIVEKAPHNIYSSANNYVTGKGLVNVEFADNPVVNVTKTNEFWKYNNYEE